jgi:hypothetical protein
MIYYCQLANAAANAAADAVAAKCDNGYLRLYNGDMPADCDTAITTQTNLATLRYAATAESGSASAGVATFAALTSDTNAAAGGTPTWSRSFESDGTTPVWQGYVGTTSDYPVVIDSVPIVAGDTVACSVATYTENKG